MKQDKLIPILLIGVVAYLVISKKSSSGNLNSGYKRNELLRITIGESNTAFRQMTDAEIGIVYDAIFNYINKGLQVPAALRAQMDIIGRKYNIFT